MNVLEQLKKMKGRWIGNGQTVALKVDDVIAALEQPRMTKEQHFELSRVRDSMYCVIQWIERGCTRGPEAKELELILARLQKAMDSIPIVQ